MNKLAVITKKNFLILIKSRLWLIVVVLAPLLVIFLTGIAFDNLNQYKINIGVYSQSYTQLTNSFISKLNTQQFRTIKSKSEVECVDDVKIGLSHTCVIFPSELILGAKNKVITIFIDYSNLNLAWVIRDLLFSRVEERSTEITKQLTENILSKLIITRGEIENDIVILEVVELNEKNISNKTDEVFYLVSDINTSVGLNSSDIDRLWSKISSIKTTYDITVDESVRNIELSKELVESGDFTTSEVDDFLADIDKQKSAILGQQSYVESLFSPQYSGSINITVNDIRNRINRINKNSNITQILILKSKGDLYDLNQLNILNSKITNKIAYSMEGIKKNLENIDELSAEDIAAPVVAEIEPITSYSSYLNYIFPTLMVMAIMLAALLLSSIVVVMELNSQAYFRNFISPTSSFLFFFAYYLTNLSLIGLQTLLMLLISIIFFFTQVISNIIVTLAICFLVATFFIVLGMGIGYLFKREQISILAATFTASILLFLSNILMPIENMPEFFMNIVRFNPFIISVSLLRRSVLFKQSLIVMNEEVFFMAVFTLSLL
ncbi:ABC transporter permease, partial [Candidatus Woesearchaeota archaeon]|nr:ABC transporter permease [Candidatus Woesearchaeota archaeon]